MTIFFRTTTDCEVAYENIRDSAQHDQTRLYVESLWSTYAPYADEHFLDDAPKHFQERFWEMYLGNTLLVHGFCLARSSKAGGPDFSITVGGKRIWIEATAPSAGVGDNAVPPMQDGVAEDVPGDAITLRIRHAIYEKKKQWENHLKKGLVQPGDGYIVAINSKRIRTIVSEGQIPYIVKSVYPFGAYAIALDRNSLNVVDSRFEYREKILKKKGKSVSTDIFLNPDHAAISAVLYSSVDCANHPAVFGADFITVHNSVAAHRLPMRTFPFGTEYWIDDDFLHRKYF